MADRLVFGILVGIIIALVTWGWGHVEGQKCMIETFRRHLEHGHLDLKQAVEYEEDAAEMEVPRG